MPPRSRPVVHLELHTGDLPGASAFYSELCGWRPEWIHAGGGSYLALDMGRRQGGGIVECTTAQPLWLPVRRGARDRRRDGPRAQLGASVLLGPREGPAGWRSVVEHARRRRDRLLAAEALS